ncbi:LysR family transcriptional regulator [Blastopirellula sp. J2-11]|uniref:LysR family transcriptional regulator n=1 Tax=Blastopirellula sp. J2-11 TaxID=2943192 RepID=UPI0021C71E8B|nr:LysR family transcriptional regulator [Blastopirellula sp. J2-11]UUO04548.1 LysR family transcriptional regulator [Blastopirellula sp. J2-11]
MLPADVENANELVVQQLRSFCLVYEHRSYAAAAQKTGRSAPTLWEQVRSVEKRYGVVLFRRKGRRIEPTASAEVLYISLLPLLAGIDSTFEQIREFNTLGADTVTIVTGVRMMCEELGDPLAKFHKAMPKVRLRIVHGDDDTAVRMISEGTADLALTLERGAEQRDTPVSSERAYAIDYLAIFPMGHPLKKRKSLELAELIKYPIIVGHRGTSGRVLFEQALHRLDLLGKLQIAAETDNSAFTISCVRAGLGVGIVAGQAIESPLTYQLEKRSLSHSLGQAYVVFRRKKGRQATKVIRALMDLIRECGG